MDDAPPKPPPPATQRPLDYETDAGTGCLLGGLAGLFGIPALYMIGMVCGIIEYDGAASMFALIFFDRFLRRYLGSVGRMYWNRVRGVQTPTNTLKTTQFVTNATWPF